MFGQSSPWARYSAMLVRAPILALVLGMIGLQATTISMSDPLGAYDEGLLVTNAFLMEQGEVPFRDFYANYPPGSFLLARACAWLFDDKSIHAMRLLALATRLAAAVLAAMLVGRVTQGRGRVATFATIVLLQSSMGLSLFAYVIAVLIALTAILAFPAADDPQYRYGLWGVLFGMVSWFRHDLFAYATLLFFVVILVVRLVRPLSIDAFPRQGLRSMALGLAAAVVPFWIPLVFLAGPSRMLHDLLLDQARHTMPARLLPLPDFGGWYPLGLLNLTVPRAIANATSLGLLFLFAGVIAAIVQFALLLRRHNLDQKLLGQTGLIVAFVIAAIPQATQRVDIVHVGYVAPLTVACLYGSIRGIPMLREIGVLAAFVSLLSIQSPSISPDSFVPSLRLHPDDAFIPPDRRTLRDFIQRESSTEDRIFAGCITHSRLVINFVSIYFETKRRGVTRTLQFDPGMTTRDSEQQKMIAELEDQPPKFVILADGCFWNEPNASMQFGSQRLDQYLASHFVPVHQFGQFRVLRRP